MDKYKSMLSIAIVVIVILLFKTVQLSNELEKEQSRSQELEDSVSQLEDKNQRLGEAVETSQNAVNDLSDNVDRLQNENWQDVTPDIEDSTDEANSAIQEASDISEE